MKAICFERAGEPSEVLRLREISEPEPGAGEVRLRLIGSPINPADLMFIKGEYRFKPVFPETGGLEGGGVIESTGPGVNLRPGQKAAFFARKAWAEYVVVPASDLILLPDNLPDSKVVQSFLNPVTAWGLLDEAGVKEGEWILLTAGNSAVSRIVTQIAFRRGIEVILVVRNSSSSDELKSLGAKEVIDSSTGQISGRVLDMTKGKGADAILDSVGGKIGTELFDCIAVNGRIVVYGVLSRDKAEFHNSVFLYRNIVMKGFGIRGYLQSKTEAEKGGIFSSIAHTLSDDDFKLDVSKWFAFEKYSEAFQVHQHTERTGKIILRPR